MGGFCPICKIWGYTGYLQDILGGAFCPRQQKEWGDSVRGDFVLHSFYTYVNQERALRFVYGDYNSSYTELLSKASLPTLETRRIKTMVIETFKILNRLARFVLSDLLIKRENKCNFRYSNILQIPQVKTSTQGKKYFRYAAPVLWNS